MNAQSKLHPHKHIIRIMRAATLTRNGETVGTLKAIEVRGELVFAHVEIAATSVYPKTTWRVPVMKSHDIVYN